MLVWFPSYLLGYGPSHFLWLSDVFLIEAFLATCLESSFLASMGAAGGLLFSIAWAFDFVGTTIFHLFGSETLGGTAYLYDATRPLWLRLLSLFHLGLPIVLYFLVSRLGYNRRAWPLQILLSWAVIALSYRLSDPDQDLNFVHSITLWTPGNWGPITSLILGSCGVALVMFATHLVLQKLLRKR